MIIHDNDAKATLKDVGGKGYSLLKMKLNGFKVPDFFIVSTKCFDAMMKDDKIRNNIKELYKKNDFVKIKEIIKSQTFSKTFSKKLQESFDLLNTKKVSVRSSGTFEDSSDKSCAGQFETFLNVERKDLEQRVKDCIASFFSANLKSYMENEVITGSIAVVVQKMINSEYSGVCFSTDYVEQNSNYCIIEVTRGLGDSLVSGIVTPSKYFVRKRPQYIDFIIGKNLKIDPFILKIASQAKKIEKLYGVPMDIEYAIEKGKLYILQARPIVSTFKQIVPFGYIMSRPRPLFMLEIVQKQEYEGIKKLFNNLYWLKPLHIFKDGHYEEYGNLYSLEENPFCMVKRIYDTDIISKNKIEEAYKACQTVEKMVQGQQKFNIDLFVKSFQTFGALNTVCNFLEHTTATCDINIKIPKKKLNEIIKYREYFDNVKYDADDFIENEAKKYISHNLQKYIYFMTLDEVFKGKKVNVKSLEKRLQGFLFFDKKLYEYSKLSQFCKENNIKINFKKDQIITGIDTIKGNVAFPGEVVGKAKIVYSVEDLKKVKKGDIIVSPMTVPTFIDAMKIAGAFVTDEGGTVCHAALIARELKKPCVVGTKNATVVLKDDMKICVDATNGIIKILK